ncbi:SSI family serine proteinase inhibitor [Nocardiopsis sp. NPDC058631]|uniref:SSI family serine proteinase inhibitor n=1 Tax=Nocardiopsis sp. NPDC058631 TaxID=3346566 RepID=UPI003667AAF6
MRGVLIIRTPGAAVHRTALALVATAALSLAFAAPAHAVQTERTVTTSHTLSIRSLSSGETRQVTLECRPTGGNHPEAEKACAAITGAGSIARTKGEDRPCPMIYDPVVATAEGSEDYEEEFANSCVLVGGKGAVYDF